MELTLFINFVQLGLVVFTKDIANVLQLSVGLLSLTVRTASWKRRRMVIVMFQICLGISNTYFIFFSLVIYGNYHLME